MSEQAIISLCAGKSERFGGNCKSGLIVNGETLRDRTERLFGAPFVFTRDMATDSLCTCDSMLRTKDKWKDTTIILLGDVYYTEECTNSILSNSSDIVFFSDMQDIFAIKFKSNWINKIIQCLGRAIRSGRNNGRLWEMYRHLHGLGNNSPLPYKNSLIYLVADKTQDFDSEEEYNDFLISNTKNKQLRIAKSMKPHHTQNHSRLAWQSLH